MTSLDDVIIWKEEFDEIYQYAGFEHPKYLYFYAEKRIWEYRERCDIELDYAICYNEKKIIYFRKLDMKGQFFIAIPYECRTKYIDAICEINHLVDTDGMVVLAVNNNPYILESYLVVETNTNVEEISERIRHYNLYNSTEKGLRELIIELGNKRWNIAPIFSHSNPDEIREIMNGLYWYAEKDELKDKGFFDEMHKPKIFISYCHIDQKLVLDVYNRMEMAGINCWLDLQDIDVGEIIAKKMLDGIRQCDFAIFFLSHAYKQSMMAKAELQNFLADVFREKKAWYLIKVDDVDVEDIQAGLSHYKYYDLSENGNVDLVVEDIIRVFQK